MNSTPLHPDWLDWPEVRRLTAAFDANGSALRFVGGAVRDTLLGLPIKDIDAATSLLPEMVMALLKEAGIKAIPTGIEHGTVTAVVGTQSFEITTLRRDVQTFGRHAKVEYTDDWEHDAARRDFTINALYLSPAGELFDYFGGCDDLKAGRIRFIGKPKDRIVEDYLRILRFFRFYARFGKGVPDEAAINACVEMAAHISELSAERVQMEMLKLLAVSAPSAALENMQGAVARYAFGGAINLVAVKHLERVERELSLAPDSLLRLAALLTDSSRASALSRAWKLSNADSKRLAALLEFSRDIGANLSLAEQKKWLRRAGAALFRQSAILHGAITGEKPKDYAPLLSLANSWVPPQFPLSGEDLKEIGMKEGKSLGDILKRLEEAWETSDYTLTREELLTKI